MSEMSSMEKLLDGVEVEWKALGEVITRYFANTTQRDKNSFDFTMHWAMKDNTLIKDLKDFTATFFEKRTLLKVLLQYSVFGAACGQQEDAQQ